MRSFSFLFVCIVFSFGSFAQVDFGKGPGARTVSTASFLAPDNVCTNQSVTITNTTTTASSYYWNFCGANATTNPDGTNLGNFGFNQSVFVDYAKDGDKWYAVVTNNTPGKLVRLDFGNSLLNTPTAHDFDNLGGVIPEQCEGSAAPRSAASLRLTLGRRYPTIYHALPTGATSAGWLTRWTFTFFSRAIPGTG
jgi:hypothetical protein